MTFTRRPDRKLEELRRLPILRTCSLTELRQLARVADVSLNLPGTPLAQEHRPQRWVHLLADGTATVTVDGRTVGTLGAGDTVGEAWALAGDVATATVVSDGPGRSFVIGARELRSLLAQSPALTAILLERLSQRVVTLESASLPVRPRLRVVTGG